MKWGLTTQELQRAIDELRSGGMRLMHLYGYALGGIPRFAAIFEKRQGDAPVLSLDISAADSQRELETRGKGGYRPKVISGYQIAAGERMTALWEKGGPWAARYGLPLERYEATVDELTKRDWRLVSLSAYAGTSGARLNMIWSK